MNNEIELLSDEEERDLISAHKMTGEPIEKLREWRKAKILEEFQHDANKSWEQIQDGDFVQEVPEVSDNVTSFTSININVH